MKRTLLSATLALLLSWPALGQGVGGAAPDFSYPALGQGLISLSDYQGKVVFIFLFGNTCPFCLAVGNRTENEVHQVYRFNPSFQAIGLDLWTNSSTTASVNSFRSRTGVTYPLGLQAGTMSSLYATTYDRLLVIGPDGVLRFKGTSNVSSTLEAAKAVIDELLAAIATGTEQTPQTGFSLAPGYPNPFSQRTELVFQTPAAGDARVSIHDLLGREVAVLAEGMRPAGIHRVTFDAPGHLPPGVYTCTLETTRGRLTRTLALVR